MGSLLDPVYMGYIYYIYSMIRGQQPQPGQTEAFMNQWLFYDGYNDDDITAEEFFDASPLFLPGISSGVLQQRSFSCFPGPIPSIMHSGHRKGWNYCASLLGDTTHAGGVQLWLPSTGGRHVHPILVVTVVPDDAAERLQ